MNSLLQLITVNLKIFWREPGILFWAILFPILMAWVLGIAFTSNKETQQTVFIFPEGSKAIPVDTLITGRSAGISTLIIFEKGSKNEAYAALRKGKTNVLLEQKDGKLYFHYDPNNSEAVNTFLLLERELADQQPVENIQVVPVTTQGNRYVDFLIPGLIALGIMNSCIWGISWTLIDVRIKKLLRRMVATPMKKSTFIFSHFLARIVITSFEAIVLFAFAYFYFDISITGSIAGLLCIYLSGVFAFSGIAVLVGSRTASSQVGNGLINAATLPMMILSGIFFSYHNFPEWALPVIQYLPLTLLADTIRSLFNEGLSFYATIFPSIILIVTGIISTAAGIKLFKWY